MTISKKMSAAPNRFSKFTVFPIISNSLESIVNARIENKQLQRVVLHFQHL